ncbi:hypothetical protein APY04_0119 [Hyphomicrobium sulfonivorans]|uniref:Uncharacterized protein n=1 Tax=Hyphomicrobium sulfonivorans TaxID=121290 RepID=A0A109BP81_HYPSL|nr:hypothetical protein APY04_0119 [Hyphomicrobium sulfonivorans]
MTVLMLQLCVKIDAPMLLPESVRPQSASGHLQCVARLAGVHPFAALAR